MDLVFSQVQLGIPFDRPRALALDGETFKAFCLHG
jgi:hypothetical protein